MEAKSIVVGKVWVDTAIVFAVESDLDFSPSALEQKLQTACTEAGFSAAVEITRVRKGRYNVLASKSLDKEWIVAALSEIERKTAAAVEQTEWLDLLRKE